MAYFNHLSNRLGKAKLINLKTGEITATEEDVRMHMMGDEKEEIEPIVRESTREVESKFQETCNRTCRQITSYLWFKNTKATKLSKANLLKLSKSLKMTKGAREKLDTILSTLDDADIVPSNKFKKIAVYVNLTQVGNEDKIREFLSKIKAKSVFSKSELLPYPEAGLGGYGSSEVDDFDTDAL